MKPDIDWWTVFYITSAAGIIIWGFKRLIGRFDSLISVVQKLDKSMILSNYRIKNLEHTQRIHNKRLNQHSEKIKELELKRK